MVPASGAFQQTDREIAHAQLDLSIERIKGFRPKLRAKSIAELARCGRG